MQHPKILIQFDTDLQPSVFDSVVALDSGIDQLLPFAAVEPTNVLPLVHGAMFTRGPGDLHNTAIFVGGSQVAVGEAIGHKIKEAFFGPMRVSVMLDGNGSNTTAAAAVLCAARHTPLANSKALVLGGTGPVGGRVARLLLKNGADVTLVSRDLARAETACSQLLARSSTDAQGRLRAIHSQASDMDKELSHCTLLFGCGAAGIPLLNEKQMQLAKSARVAIDLNAVPPAGLADVQVMDKAVERNGRIDYGAIGVGGLKMKIHRAAIQELFSRNDRFLDAEEIFEIGQSLDQARLA